MHLDGAGAEDEGGAREERARAEYRDGDDGEAGFEREAEAALLEGLKRAVARACALGVEEGRDAGAYLARGALERGHGLRGRAPVDGDVARAAHVPAEEGNQEDLALGRDAKLRGQVAEHDGDVHVAL